MCLPSAKRLMIGDIEFIEVTICGGKKIYITRKSIDKALAECPTTYKAVSSEG